MSGIIRRALWVLLSTLMPPVQIEPGQRWVREYDGIALRVERVQRFGKHNVEVHWRGVDDPSRGGAISTSTFGWLAGFTRVAETRGGSDE